MHFCRILLQSQSMGVPLYAFPLPLLILFLIFFSIFNYSVKLFGFICFGTLCFLELGVCFLSQFRKIFSYYSFK